MSNGRMTQKEVNGCGQLKGLHEVSSHLQMFRDDKCVCAG